jgi:hypothetical protein
MRGIFPVVNRKIALTPALSRGERGFRAGVHFVTDSNRLGLLLHLSMKNVCWLNNAGVCTKTDRRCACGLTIINAV